MGMEALVVWMVWMVGVAPRSEMTAAIGWAWLWSMVCTEVTAGCGVLKTAGETEIAKV